MLCLELIDLALKEFNVFLKGRCFDNQLLVFLVKGLNLCFEVADF